MSGIIINISYLPKINKKCNGRKSGGNLGVTNTEYGAGHIESGDEEKRSEIEKIEEGHGLMKRKTLRKERR